MPFSVSVYTDPGVYIQEVVVPGQINIAGQPLTACLIGNAARTKTASDEAVVRALIEAEALTLAGSSPYVATLVYHGDRNLDNTTVYRNGVALADSQVTFPAAVLTGTAAGTYDLSTNNAFGVQVDGQDPVTVVVKTIATLIHDAVQEGAALAFPGPIRGVLSVPAVVACTFAVGWQGGDITLTGFDANGVAVTEVVADVAGATVNSVALFSRITSISKELIAGAADTVTIGTAATNAACQPIFNTGGAAVSAAYDELSATIYVGVSGITINAATRANVVTAINTALGSVRLAVSKGYGTTYAAVATDATTGVRITSPLTGTTSDVRVFAAVAVSAAATVWGTVPARASTVVRVADASYVSGATYTADYLADDDDEVSGTGVSLTNGATVTLTQTGTTFATTDVGKYITVSNCATAANNGRFKILTRPSTATVTYTNAAGVGEVSSFLWTLEPRSDALVNAATSLTAVGSFAGTSTFLDTRDFVRTGGVIDWSYPDAAQQAVMTGTVTGTGAGGAGFYDLNAATGADNDHLRLQVDNHTAFDLNLGGADLPADRIPIGYDVSYTNSKDDIQLADLVTNINAMLANHPSYGPRQYRSVASASSNALRLTSPLSGSQGQVRVMAPVGATVGDASTELLGGRTEVLGIGTRPSAGTTYFVTYAYTRPSTDYNLLRQHFSLDQALAELGAVATDNELAIAAEIAFLNGAPTITTVQLNNATNQPGSGDSSGDPTLAEVQAGLAASARSSTPTEVVLVGAAGTSLQFQVELLQHVETQTGPLEKNYRRGWYGMAAATAIGDKNTADTLVYRAARTLQYAAASPGRGRAILVAPPQLSGVTRTLQLADGSIAEEVALDSTFLAVAVAAKFTSFTSIAEALVRKTIRGFDLATLTNPILKAERHRLASYGVLVVTLDAGRLILVDPISTERAGGAVIHFEQIQATGMKDNVTRKVDQALDANIVGIVPSDLASFLVDIKSVIASVLVGEISSGSIGPFRDTAGAARSIDLTKDIEVEQDANDPTKFNFRYFYNLRYPALRLFGQYSVDNPFFVQS